ncbi:hypothetical protein CP532_4785 [Ophiocordyceps camponoti-leonardi (nom. inval.)]|nr:hypothetical protein CP532_4785 [Ophiocordyceps camponoti-leonardi (nom. inval.)]
MRPTLQAAAASSAQTHLQVPWQKPQSHQQTKASRCNGGNYGNVPKLDRTMTDVYVSCIA